MKKQSPSAVERQPILNPFHFQRVKKHCEGRKQRLEINQTSFNALVAKRLTKFSTSVTTINGVNRL